jgi:hypothetical protein
VSARDYEHDEWIPWYVADTEGWLELSLAARGAAEGIARKMNRKGELSLRRGLSGLAKLLGCRWEELEPALAELIAQGRVVWDGSRFLLSDPGYVARKRKGSADRVREHRAREKAARDACNVTSVTGDQSDHVTDVTPVLVLSDLISSDLRSDLASGPPAWFGTALDVIEMNTGEKLPAGEAWLRYDGHRAGKGIEPTAKDAQYWLTTVMVPELRKARDETARRNASDEKRTAAFVRERHGPEVKPLPSVAPLMRERDEWERTAASPEEQAAMAANLSKLLGRVGT